MIFSRDNEHFKEFCSKVGLGNQEMEQHVWPQLFKVVNQLMEASCKCSEEAEVVAPVTVEQDKPDFDKMGDDALRKWLTDNDAKPHHMAKRETLLKAAKEL